MAIRSILHQDLHKTIKEFSTYRKNTDKQIRLVKSKIAKLQKIIKSNMILEDKLDSYEDKAVKSFESKKKKANMKFVPLNALD